MRCEVNRDQGDERPERERQEVAGELGDHHWNTFDRAYCNFNSTSSHRSL